MGYTFTGVSGATAAVTNRFVVSVDMRNGDYTLANGGAMPTAGARHVTCTRTATDTADTGGTIEITGTDLRGQVISEILTVGASTVLVTGTLLFATVTKVTGAGWAVDEAEGTKDKIVVGCDAAAAVVDGAGTLHAIVINGTAAGTITVDGGGRTIATIPSNVAVGTYYLYDVDFSGYLAVTLAAASNITLIHTASQPTSYRMA